MLYKKCNKLITKKYIYLSINSNVKNKLLTKNDNKILTKEIITAVTAKKVVKKYNVL